MNSRMPEVLVNSLLNSRYSTCSLMNVPSYYSARSPWESIIHQLMNVPMEQKGINWNMRYAA